MPDFAGLPVGKPEELGFAPERLARIGKTMAAAVEKRAVPGVATVVARHGKVVHVEAQGYLDVERRNPLGIDALYRMYSQTKPVTAVAVMQLFEDGALMLDDPISKYLPEFAHRRVACESDPAERVRGEILGGIVTEPARREIIIRDLLTMTSGIPSMRRTPAVLEPLLRRAWEGTGFLATDDRINDPPGTYQDLVLALAALPLHSQPGEVWHYGSDFDVLTLIVERVSGQPIDDFMRRRIFEPLGMQDSGFYCGAERLDRLVTDHQWDAQGQLVIRDRPETSEKAGGSQRRLMSGNGLFGGLLSTAADYARFAQMLLDGGKLDGVQILGRKTVELMTTNHIGAREIDIVVQPGYGFGFGYAVRKTIAGSTFPGSAGTFGWGGAAGTWFFVDPAEDLFGLFFTHVFGYQFSPTADLFVRFEKMAYEALV